jgi:hypothetical protein
VVSSAGTIATTAVGGVSALVTRPFRVAPSTFCNAMLLRSFCVAPERVPKSYFRSLHNATLQVHPTTIAPTTLTRQATRRCSIH